MKIFFKFKSYYASFFDSLCFLFLETRAMKRFALIVVLLSIVCIFWGVSIPC